MLNVRYLLIALCGSLILLPAGASAQYYGYSPQRDEPNITVTGDAEIKVSPDKAIITLGVETIDNSIVKAKAENDRIAESVTNAIRKLGVDRSDIHTDYLNVQPKYDRWRDLGSFLGNNVKRRIVVTLKDISRFDELISKAIEAGVTHVLDISFNVEDLRKYRDQARAMAIKAAADKARDLTSEIGQTVGKAIDIRENRSYQRSWYSGWNWDYYYRGSGSGAFNASQNVASPESGEETPMAIGKISVTASVSVSFLLE